MAEKKKYVRPPERIAYENARDAVRREDPVYQERKRQRERERYQRIKDTPEYKARCAASIKRQRESGDKSRKDRVRAQTRAAVKSGILVSGPCEVCGIAEVQAHHDDYSNPLQVRWLCAKHHTDHHRRERRALKGIKDVLE